jgi:hypothetical protein
MQRIFRLKLYIVVEVWRGIAASAKNFTRLRDAKIAASPLGPPDLPAFPQ